MTRRALKALWIAIGASVLAVAAYGWTRLATAPPPTGASDDDRDEPALGPGSPRTCGPTQGRALTPPSDQPPQVTCEEAHRIVLQARHNLAQSPAGRINPKVFADAVIDWLDPHGHWSAAPDAPVGESIGDHASRLLAALENGDPAGCESAKKIGARLAAWIGEIRGVYDETLQNALFEDPTVDRGWMAAAEPAFENGPATRSARVSVQNLARSHAQLLLALGDSVRPYVDRARLRLFPVLEPDQWGNALLAAAVRSHVAQIDPHGAWAPLDEETSLYEVELESNGRVRLWQKMTRTAIGLHVDEGALPPLANSDVVVSIAGVATAGLSVEQAEQLGILDPADPGPAREIVVLRPGQSSPLALHAPTLDDLLPDEATPSVAAERLAFGDGESIVLRIHDVPEDLGSQVATLMAEQREHSSPLGVLLDLRGNGGGSTEGARSAIGLFLPGASLFPMRRRDGTIEVERATEPPLTDRWDGPVAALVDGATASAAEMIAGALASYRRAVVAGSRTYGKGCAQEYMDDVAGVGALRLTTIVYALPDGTPVQRVGIVPSMLLGAQARTERESILESALPAWRGPDRRDRWMVRDVAWPPHGGRVGPCHDETICAALRALGAPRMTSARGREKVLR